MRLAFFGLPRQKEALPRVDVVRNALRVEYAMPVVADRQLRRVLDPQSAERRRVLALRFARNVRKFFVRFVLKLHNILLLQKVISSVSGVCQRGVLIGSPNYRRPLRRQAATRSRKGLLRFRCSGYR